jgi:nucleotide-binding universal stress UspA family protein
MRYLVATDGSEESNEAVRYASTHAIAFDATLEIVHVLQPEAKLKDGEVILPGGDKAAEQGDRILDQARRLAARTVDEAAGDIPIDTELLTGRPASAITDRARETGADAIYVGHEVLSEASEQMVGSVAKSIIDKATVPVTVIR